MATKGRVDADVVIAGGGPAGLATAIAAASRGLSVLVVDAAHPSIDKACGEGLMPDALAALCALGITIPEDDASPFLGIRFLSGGPVAEACFPGSCGYAVRRTVLHSILLARAEQAGVRFAWGNRIVGLQDESLMLDSRSIRARWIVGADGLQSRVRCWSGLDRGRVLSRRIAMRRHYRIAPWSRFVEVYWRKRSQAYVTAVGHEEVCVAFVAREKHPSTGDPLDDFPELNVRLGHASLSSEPRGAVTLGRKLDRVTRGRVALVGDASGSVDAITGEGLGIAFRQAIALADALAREDLTAYESAHRAIARVPQFMSRTMLLMDRSPLLRDHTLRAFARSPQLFARMLRVHIGDSPLHWTGDAGVLQLGWKLLTA